MTAWALYEEELAKRSPADLVLRAADGRSWPFPVSRWAAAPDAADRALLRRCAGPTLDLGCGPGRLVCALARRGVPALGVDLSPAAVRRTVAAGGSAVLRDVFDRLPGEGRWPFVLVMDGNVGIGGDVPALLRRLAGLLGPGGRAVVETLPKPADEVLEVRLGHPDGRTGPVWSWARIGPAGLARHAEPAGLRVAGTVRRSRRSFTLLAGA